MNIIRFEELGKANFGWLQANYHFSFFRYYNINRMSFGKLRVVNDDVVAPKTGFDTHYHENMEIITYVKYGVLTHRDSEGNMHELKSGGFQVMSAGSGIHHSEHNFGEEDLSLYQIWIEPHTLGLPPSWHDFQATNIINEVVFIASGRAEHNNKGILKINQNASIAKVSVAKGKSVNYQIFDQVYLLVCEGRVRVNNKALNAGDAAEIEQFKNIDLFGEEDSDVIIIDVVSA